MTPQAASLHILGTQPKLRPWPGLCLPLARAWGSQPRRPRTSLLRAVLGTVWLEGATPRPRWLSCLQDSCVTSASPHTSLTVLVRRDGMGRAPRRPREPPSDAQPRLRADAACRVTLCWSLTLRPELPVSFSLCREGQRFKAGTSEHSRAETKPPRLSLPP